MKRDQDRKHVTGYREQQQLREDPGVLQERQGMDDPAADAAVAQRRKDELRQQFRDWWGSLDPDRMLRYLNKRDELLLLLHEQYNYTPDEASREAEELLKRFHAGLER